MTNLPQRTSANTRQEHLSDHNILHEAVNELTNTPSSGVVLGYAIQTASQAGITTVVDLTGLTDTVTVAANRLLRITGYTNPTAVTNNVGPELRIQEGGTQLSAARLEVIAVGAGFRTMICQALVVAPSAGSHTYKLTMLRDSGVGTVTNTASATLPSFILIEDVGPA